MVEAVILISEEAATREEHVQPEHPRKVGARRGVAVARTLEAPIGIAEEWAARTGLGMVVHELHEPSERAGTDDSVAVQEKEVAAGTQGEPLVVGQGVSSIAVVQNDAGFGMGFPEKLHAAIRGSIVYHDDF
jgi:hypothetical protein